MSEPAKQLTTGICDKCGEPFDYLRGRKRRLFCPRCLVENNRDSKTRHRKSRELGDSKLQACAKRPMGASYRPHRAKAAKRCYDPTDAVAKMSTEEIARREGVSAQAIQKTLQKALGMIRKSPELKNLWALFTEEGRPVPKAETDYGEQILEWQLELARWYELYEQINEPETQEEAAAVLAEIQKFSERIGVLIEKFRN
ncbi:MAG TPA: hypothetical protein VH413_16395 [Verrucomicrobiae bacterium]|nr:hypothetical protein [Verrucomicrobiae bacterium]